ncbi:hypothetical protein SPRG_11658 [Saprolegnia parasitica CBS 223.65]|uniref:Uncharacterized protein n=1 Tax=Saprolegnia parasitica (strain CBS 223.65) TaxID=695850 RepID=A0A067BXU2_SAPPC|nr:hypothetical protein SPRG_11658 [Saprolegnia parasitica CBS 223.65]KDO23344.1 hypothetical protein SPRG_11658 [Saprolegnia parasitica CBS 223.65]|eukprot:XP_012205995.1 hypothetical protein SPRG_11658 [Saprolegnia parasitica CBS 223.65]
MTANWDAVDDLHPTVFAYAGGLTQWLNGTLKLDGSEDNDVASELWADAFRLDWPGDLATLPRAYLGPQRFRLIRSKDMYKRVMQVLYHGEEIQGGLFTHDVVFYADASYAPYRDDSVLVAEIMAAPMENVWLDKLASLLETPKALATAAALGGHTRLLEYLVREKGVNLAEMVRLHRPVIGFVMDMVAYYGHLETLRLLHEAGSTGCSVAAMDNAASNGFLDIVRWLHAHRVEGCSAAALNGAINNGHVEIVAFLRQHYPELDVSSDAMDEAAGSGRLDVVRYLHEQCHAPCTTKSLDAAAYHGYLDIVQYLHTHRHEGCTTEAMDGAACNGYLEVIEFLDAYRSEGCTTFAFDTAARNNHMAILQFLSASRTEGGTTKAMDRAAHRGHFDVVRFLHDHRPEGCTTRAIDWAAAAGHLAIVEFLMENRREGFTYRGMFWAARDGHLDVLAYLLAHDSAKKAARAVQRALDDRSESVFVNLKAAQYPGTTTVDMAAIEWDDEVDGCFAFNDEEPEEDGEECYYDWDSDNSTEGCMFW